MNNTAETIEPIHVSGERFPSRRSTIMSLKGMIATEQPLAAQAGIRMLLHGGNAVDAAVAAMATLSVVRPAATGIGGDAFALIYWEKTGEIKALNASGRAPQAATLGYFREKGLRKVPETGMLPVTVPGALNGWVTLLDSYGTMSLARVLEPAIVYAEEGFPVTELAARGWHKSIPKLSAHPDTARTYLPDGRAPRPGDIFRQPNLARTLRLIAEGGPDVFYRGEIAESIVHFSKENGGLLAAEDLAQHNSTWVEPISTDYRGYQVYECPPNGQGLAVLLALNLIRVYDLAQLRHNSVEYLHILIEAMKLAFADAHEYVADPEFADIPLEQLLSPSYTEARRGLIDGEKASTRVYPGLTGQGNDTAYLTVVDRDGNAVSLIGSLYMGFGSGMVVGDTGICLQNRGALFSLNPEHRNCIAPGKRPFHTIIPAMVCKEGKLFASFGVTGGSMQPQGHMQVLCNLIDFQMLPQEALDAPRFRYVVENNEVYLEKGIEEDIQRALARKGHKVVPFDTMTLEFGAGQLIILHPDSGALLGASDPRKDGCAVGY